MFKGKLFGSSKPKNVHSLENLKHLYNVLVRHQTVTESNRALLVETLRSISEILIWGDQNDSTVFDYFLEKNMLAFFLRYLEQKSGQFICVQLLQTLNILFENISNETSIYYLLSNNHVNQIVSHKFDFTDEEVMAYFISFMKTLSLKLNRHTIHFFFNEQSEDFPLYTEAIKFFNHAESMVRIAVRTITLNVYRVDNTRMQNFIRERTAVPYFTNLMWYMGKHVIALDSCVRNDTDHKSRDRLSDLVAEHLDHLHYLNDILGLDIEQLNDVLTDHLLNRLYIPLYVNSLIASQEECLQIPHISSSVALFLLAQVFLILHHKPLVRRLADLLFSNTRMVPQAESIPDSDVHPHVPRFVEPTVGLQGDFVHEERRVSNSIFYPSSTSEIQKSQSAKPKSAIPPNTETMASAIDSTDSVPSSSNTTDDEKVQHLPSDSSLLESLNKRPYMKAIFECLDSVDDDYNALLALCLLYAICENKGINQELLDTVHLTSDKSTEKGLYNTLIVDKLIKIVTLSGQFGGRVRLATLELAMKVLEILVLMSNGENCLRDNHLALLEGTKEESMMLLRTVFKGEEMFLDMFEDEYREMEKRTLNVEYLTMDASVLLQPTGTPLTGIEFTKRLPCGEVERARRAIRVYFHIRKCLLQLNQQGETQLPLTKPSNNVRIGEVLDLNNSDLIGCTVVKDSQTKKERRFLVIDVSQLIMVEPDASRLGWGVVRFAGPLQDVEVAGDKEDSRCLHVTVHKPASSHLAKPFPLLTAKFIFDDHIRCMAAKQRLTKGRTKARQRKMMSIAQMLEMPANETSSILQPVSTSIFSSTHRPLPGRVIARSMAAPVTGRSADDVTDGTAVEQGVAVSEPGIYDALNSSPLHSAITNTEQQPSDELSAIPLADLSARSRTNSEEQSRSSSLTANCQQSADGSSSMVLFGAKTSELKDV